MRTPLKEVEVADFVGNRVLGHRREGSQDVHDARGRSTFVPQHVVDQGEGVAAAQLAQWPVPQGDALDLHVEHAADAVVVRGVGALRSWVAFGPGLGVLAEGVGSIRKAVRLFNRPLSIGLALERAPSSVPGRLPDVVLAVAPGVAGDPDHLA